MISHSALWLQWEAQVSVYFELILAAIAAELEAGRVSNPKQGHSYEFQTSARHISSKEFW